MHVRIGVAESIKNKKPPLRFYRWTIDCGFWKTAPRFFNWVSSRFVGGVGGASASRFAALNLAYYLFRDDAPWVDGELTDDSLLRVKYSNIYFILLNATWRLGGHWTSQKVPPTDLELTPNQQGVPRKEKKREKIWGMVLKNHWYPKTAPKPYHIKTLIDSPDPKLVFF